MTEPAGPPPHWLVLGAPKAATTTLAWWLEKHPQVCVADMKEVCYFTHTWDRGRDWYQRQFSGWRPGLRAGEATPAYFFFDAALDRIAATCPDARLVVILREPIARLTSQYWFERMMGINAASFRRTIRREAARPRRILDGWSPGLVQASTYAPRIRAVWERFPRDQLLVMFFEDLRPDPDAWYAEVCKHIGVDPVPAPEVERGPNTTRLVKSAQLQWLTWKRPLSWLPPHQLRRLRLWNLTDERYPELDAGVIADLRRGFEADKRELADLLGRPLPPSWST